jgi:hypothetical protein
MRTSFLIPFLEATKISIQQEILNQLWATFLSLFSLVYLIKTTTFSMKNENFQALAFLHYYPIGENKPLVEISE